jgi:hypothetical protein
MSIDYWNLNVQTNCPNGHGGSRSLQTHFLGEEGSCTFYYELGEVVPELRRVSVVLDGTNDEFIGWCNTCRRTYRFGAEITDGRVLRVWPLDVADNAPNS